MVAIAATQEDDHAAQTCHRRNRDAVRRCDRQRTPQGNWPDRPIKFIVHVAAGGGVDLNARILADRLTSSFRSAC